MNKEEFDSVTYGVAVHNANRHLALYLKTRDDRLIWKAYQEFRKDRLDVPESILKKLDEFAARQTTPTGEGQRDIVEFMHAMKTHSKMKPEQINRAAAEKFNTTIGYVKKVYSDWMKESKAIKAIKADRAIKDFLSKPIK